QDSSLLVDGFPPWFEQSTTRDSSVRMAGCLSARYALDKTVPKPWARGLTPRRRHPFIRPRGVEDTTGTLISFPRGTMRSSVRNEPQDMTSASESLEFE